MSKIVSCREVGVDCDFVAKGETEQEETETLSQTVEETGLYREEARDQGCGFLS